VFGESSRSTGTTSRILNPLRLAGEAVAQHSFGVLAIGEDLDDLLDLVVGESLEDHRVSIRRPGGSRLPIKTTENLA
jgi:hypothetical protein